LIEGWIEVMRLAHPKRLVVAEDVENGKPDPECYNLGRERLGLPATSSMLVVEDAPSGVRAGKAAGCKVVGLATTHDVDQVKNAGADWVIRDLRSLKFKSWDEESGMVAIEICDALFD
jgi:glycerol 3-phosphatase-1